MKNGSPGDPKSGSNQRLGLNQANGNGHNKPFLGPIKLFQCKYCARKFLNSRALGGHQNAHKKERTLWMMGLHDHNNKPMGMEHHGVVHKPIQEESKSKDSFKRFQEAADRDLMSWPGSFHIHSTDTQAIKASLGEAVLKLDSLTDLVLNSQHPDQSKICTLDLDLRL